MRPLRCSMRPGFHGRSKWKRSVQWAWKFRPSRAASVAMRIRSGSLAGSLLNRRWISFPRPPVDALDPLVGAIRAFDGLLQDCPQVALRAFTVLGEDEDPADLPRWSR